MKDSDFNNHLNGAHNTIYAKYIMLSLFTSVGRVYMYISILKFTEY